MEASVDANSGNTTSLKRSSAGRTVSNPIGRYFQYDLSTNKHCCLVKLNPDRVCNHSFNGKYINTTLENHLKKHPVQYAEFVKLKSDIAEEQAAKSAVGIAAKRQKLEKPNADLRDYANGKQQQKTYDNNDPK